MDVTTFSSLLRERLEKSGSTRISIRGGSMFPTLFHRTQIRLTRLSADEPRLGRIYAFEHRGILVAHRYAGHSTAGGYRFLSDRALGAGETTDREAIVGRVEAFYLRGTAVSVDGAPWRVVAAALRLLLAAYGRALPARVRERLHPPLRGLVAKIFTGSESDRPR